MTPEAFPIYVTLAIYILAMFAVTFIANRQNSAAEVELGEDAAIKTHFLGGKDFGVVILTLTTFASLFSGFTVVGVPNEAGKNGFTTFRWVGIVYMVGISFSIVNPRLRRLSIFRNYESPGDFIMDRYNSVALKFLAVICMCVPQILYLAVQFHALTSMITNTTGIAATEENMGLFILCKYSNIHKDIPPPPSLSLTHHLSFHNNIQKYRDCSFYHTAFDI